jgi:hypothetical protein
MGTSAREIEQEIKQTRNRLDKNLAVLEQRAASNAIRVGKIVAVVAGAAAGVVGGLLLYRRLRGLTLKDRLTGMSPGKFRPALVRTASTAILERIARQREETEP